MPITAVELVLEAFKRAQLGGDPAAAAALFADDAVMYPPFSQARVRGRPAIDQLLQAVHRRLRIVEIDYAPMEGALAGDLAHLHGRYVVRGVPRTPGAEAVTMRGRLSWVLERRDGEDWRVAVHHASLEPEAESAPADRTVSSTPAGKP